MSKTKNKKDTTLILNGRMAFINVNASNLEKPVTQDSDETVVLGLFDNRGHRTNRFTNNIVEEIDQLNILEHIKNSLGISRFGEKAQVSVRYLVSDKPIKDPEQVLAEYFSQLDGDIILNHNSHYSDLTGYLWTDNDLVVGGHDLLSELQSHLKPEGETNIFWKYRTYEKCPEKYLWLEIIKHEKNKKN